MRFFTEERLGPKQSMTPEGFLLCEDVPVARIGTQLYGPGEVPITPGPGGVIYVERSPEEVFREATLASGNGKSVTLDHPPSDVDPDNWDDLSYGFGLNFHRGSGALDDLMLCDLMVTRPEAIQAIRERKLRQISLGYDADYEETSPGRGVQKNIVINHIALVDEARCGVRCSVGDRAFTLPKRFRPRQIHVHVYR